MTSRTPVKVKEINIPKTVLKNMVMGGIAGTAGASATYPLDMVKTRLQNQRSFGRLLYKNSIDCFFTILKSEGVRGLYKGLPAQLIGIIPEKAIKLTVNDFVRYTFTNKETGEIKIYHEMLAGASAGFSQVIATNPYEIVKVRLQTATVAQTKSVAMVAKELGFRGLFRGAGACLLRDVPFSAMYFTLYAQLKNFFRNKETGELPLHLLFASGISAGVLSSGIATPADVVKTRLQVRSVKGSVPYKGIIDCFGRIIKEEGAVALFKGTVPRMMIISPLFGITLLTYEVLQGFFL